MLRNLAVITVVIAVAGCAETIPLSRQNTTKVQTMSDFDQCNRKAWNHYPVSNKDLNAGEFTTKCTAYGNQTSCSSNSKAPLIYDVTARDRWQFNFSCMQSKGYK